MAFGIGIKTQFGITANYWKIAKVEKSKISKNAYIVLNGYESKETKDYANLEPRFINIYPKDFDEVFGLEKINKEGMNEDKSIYEFIKNNCEEFEKAEFID